MTSPTPPGPVWNPEKQVYDYPSGQPSAPPPHVGQPYSEQPESSQKPRKIWPARHPVWTSLGVLAAIGVVAAAVSSGGSPATPTVAASSSAQPQITASESADGQQETTPPPPDLSTYTPKPADFKLTVKTLQKQCYGEAGCSVTFRVLVNYVGKTRPDPSKEYEVTYKVTGDESGPMINTFTVTDNKSSVPTEEDASTKSNSTVIKAVATEVSETS